MQHISARDAKNGFGRLIEYCQGAACRGRKARSARDRGDGRRRI